MARTQKVLLDVDRRIAEILASLVESAGMSRRDLAARTGISANRLGIILRQEPPPATVGEVGQIAVALGTTAGAVISEAESPNLIRLPSRNVGGRPHTDLETVELDTTKLAASTDNTPIDPSRGEG
ncbi:helix-turn-helix domain-containing protein [Microbacterium testaceum]|uniref:helix-turn-helix domain-containing protein n=1 Tax=Microbacterium testaceum TaxID=2033 RepID=UPI001D17AA88|nr:helix-turn-helix transcriptional regulator [Microbacterium testaceum]MCC4249532.1 helix-turn-helix domain-containing protein [Microbacterium testaceum]